MSENEELARCCHCGAPLLNSDATWCNQCEYFALPTQPCRHCQAPLPFIAVDPAPTYAKLCNVCGKSQSMTATCRFDLTMNSSLIGLSPDPCAPGRAGFSADWVLARLWRSSTYAGCQSVSPLERSTMCGMASPSTADTPTHTGSPVGTEQAAVIRNFRSG